MGEFAGQVDAEAVDQRDNGKRNERGDQAIFNGGGAGFIGQEFKKNSLQFASFRVAAPEVSGYRTKPKVA